jgi:hypothetical protein
VGIHISKGTFGFFFSLRNRGNLERKVSSQTACLGAGQPVNGIHFLFESQIGQRQSNYRSALEWATRSNIWLFFNMRICEWRHAAHASNKPRPVSPLAYNKWPAGRINFRRIIASRQAEEVLYEVGYGTRCSRPYQPPDPTYRALCNAV